MLFILMKIKLLRYAENGRKIELDSHFDVSEKWYFSNSSFSNLIFAILWEIDSAKIFITITLITVMINLLCVTVLYDYCML